MEPGILVQVQLYGPSYEVDMKLKSIQEHNDYIRHIYFNKNLTGVECPNCENELQYADQRGKMISAPPQMTVVCFECNYTSTLLVL